MKLSSVLFLLAAAVYSAGCSTAGVPRSGGNSFLAVSMPAAVSVAQSADANTFDFGLIPGGDIFEHSFLVRNNGTRVIKISGTVSSCGCTASSIRKNVLEPGEQTFLDVKFNSKGYSGPVTQSVYVNTDDVDNNVQKFIIKAIVGPVSDKK